MSVWPTNSSTGDQPKGSGTTSKIMSGPVVKDEKKPRSRSDPYPKNVSGRRKGGTRRESTPPFDSPEDKFEWEKKRKMKDGHNVVEKRRRGKINECISALERLLPPPYIQSKQRGISSVLVGVLKYMEDIQTRTQDVEKPTEMDGSGSQRVVELTDQIPELTKSLLECRSTIKMQEERIRELTVQNKELEERRFTWTVEELKGFLEETMHGQGSDFTRRIQDLRMSPTLSFLHASPVTEPTHTNDRIDFPDPITDPFNTGYNGESVMTRADPFLVGNQDATPYDAEYNSGIINLDLSNNVQFIAYDSSSSSIFDPTLW